jgi:hypothetical protein
MNKENKCQCVVCQVEQSLLDSLSTQTARTHFQAIATTYPVLNHFESPTDLVDYLHRQGEMANHNAGSEILQAVIHAVTKSHFEEIGQQLLLLAFTPAIHNTCYEVCQRFPALSPEDIAQQAWLVFLETARCPETLRQNGHIQIALARRFRQNLVRWAIKESRHSPSLQELAVPNPEQMTVYFEDDAVSLEKFLQDAQRSGVLSQTEHELLCKLKFEGFGAKELAEAPDTHTSHRRLHRRLQTVIDRLQRAAQSRQLSPTEASSDEKQTETEIHRKICNWAVNFSDSMCISDSEKEFSTELSRQVPQIETDVRTDVNG